LPDGAVLSIAVSADGARLASGGLHKEGLIATVRNEGVFIPTDRMADSFRSVTAEGAINWDRHSIQEVSIERAKEILFNDWTFSARTIELARRLYAEANRIYDSLGWMKAPFWPTLGWLLSIFFAIATWIFAPRKLAEWTMPEVGKPEIPKWKWLVGVLTLFSYMGQTRRSLIAWLRWHRDTLYKQNFKEREPVKERERYCNLIHEKDISTFAARRSGGRAGAVFRLGGRNALLRVGMSASR